ncbi:arrestin domain-containing protein 3 [Teleopsis dalmanni]|uniref:arrestin domain-containing protein 3 n=1 Tax=Teleopsis dalmanni TaxID=139649 RepID=UPI0018CE02E7|nr:arrestin domain-containing protein 3 [Teleopsis dalmanni]
MPTTCEFQLDRLNLVYNSGEYVKGRILLSTNKTKRVNAVYVTFEGEAKVQWSISGKNETSYYGHQQYLYTRTNVLSSPDFRAGTHIYALTLRIPEDSPSSCKGPFGYIAYSISLTIEKPWSFDEVFRKPIIVLQNLNLNHSPEFALPIRDESVKYFCNWPCKSGPICVQLILPYSGFVPMQEIPFFVEIDNQSPHYDIISVEAKLKQHFVFLAHKPLKRNFHTRTLVRSQYSESTLRLTKRLYEGKICVPSDTPRSTLNLNFIVFLHYTLQVRLKTGCCHYDADLSVPVVIGTEPLQLLAENESVTTQPTSRAQRRALLALRETGEIVDNGNITDEDEHIDDHPPSYDSCLPPSFSYATLGSQQTLESSIPSLPQETKPNQRTRINMPKFPDYNTFTSAPQSANRSVDSVYDTHLYNSSTSLPAEARTDSTGRSLDTFGSNCGILNETDESVVETEDM